MMAATPGMPVGPPCRVACAAARGEVAPLSRFAPPLADAGWEPPPERSPVSATRTDCTPGSVRTACSAAARTLSQALAAPASTVIENNTLPSLVTMSDSLPAAVSGRPSGVGMPESLASTSSFSDGMKLSAFISLR